MKKLLIPILFCLSLSIPFTGCVKNERDRLINVGDKAPHFDTFLFGGVRISSEDLLGKVTVLFFFNSKESRCREEIFQVNEIYRRIGDVVNVVAFDMDGILQDAVDYWQTYELSLPFVCCDYSKEVYCLFNGYEQYGLPMIYIINREGNVCDLFDSDRPFYAEDFYKKIIDKLY